MWSIPASSAAVLVITLAMPRVALGQGNDETTAELLFREGRALLEQHDYPTACERLRRSQDLDPATGTLILLAFCHERRGHYATAYRKYRGAVQLAEQSGDPEKADAARRFAERVRSKRHVLVIAFEGDGAGVTLRVDGNPVSLAERAQGYALDPGTHFVSAHRDGGKRWQRTLSVPSTPGRTILTIPDLSVNGPQKSQSPKPSWWSQNGLAATSLGVGVVGLGVGSYFGLRAFSQNDDSYVHCDAAQRCQPRGHELRDDAQRSATLSNIGFAVGVVGLATGTLLLLTRDASSPPSSTPSERAARNTSPSALGGRF